MLVPDGLSAEEERDALVARLLSLWTAAGQMVANEYDVPERRRSMEARILDRLRPLQWRIANQPEEAPETPQDASEAAEATEDADKGDNDDETAADEATE